MVLWQAELSDEEAEKVDDTLCDKMVEELEEAWERIKDEYIYA